MSLTLVTAADAAFAPTLAQYLASVKAKGLDRDARIAVYDLGLDPGDRTRLAARFPFAEFLPFSLVPYPAHVAPSAGTYAWKPLVIADAAERFGGRIFWFDSATLFHGTLAEPLAELARCGVYTLSGQSNLEQRCAADVRARLAVEPAFLDRRIRVSGVVGFDLEQPTARDILIDWAELALDPAVFTRADRASHNTDQAILSILLFRAEAAGRLVLNDGDIDISSPRPVRWMSSRNKLDPARPRWTDPLARLWYRLYKAGDRANLRWQDFYRRRILGMHRWPKENFRTYVMRAGDAAPTPVPCPALSYYADPFLWRRDGRLWLFVEEFRYPEQLGRLVAMELGEDLRPGPLTPVLPLREHASYPFLFEADGALYMLPETCSLQSLDLYVCDRFPDRWRRVRRIFEQADAVDSALFRHDGAWWILTCGKPLGQDGARTLALYRSEDLLTGAFEPHPVNAEGIFADGDYGFGRGAGSILRDETGLLRVMQKNLTYYGQGAEVRRITRLDAGSYREEPAERDHPLVRLAELASPHHIALHDDVVAFDVRARVGFVSGLPWIGRRLNALDPAAKRFLSGAPGLDGQIAAAVSAACRRLRPVDGRPPSSDRPCDG
ncbi:glucosamine inositolphosphorylceramide transferase family protein [Stappia indica]|uniref:Glucosamine inositolphosphorylceramide transferase 1 N-terminal domain-containing protein n=1 Tax=Stappia indica TaxID=538381 RepID=A0A285T497_9HYPH|nr:hypothetical protein [Stappia indica]SOC15909.1 hypothetical protein SAMN05421512_108190 [Stappia indica]